jgi:hypothetical protein
MSRTEKEKMLAGELYRADTSVPARSSISTA